MTDSICIKSIQWTAKEIRIEDVYLQTIEDCETKYAAYARGPQCYCTPFDGCYHRHYQVKPLVTTTNEDGLLDGKHIGVHDGDYFLEVVAINWAGLETRRDFKVNQNLFL